MTDPKHTNRENVGDYVDGRASIVGDPMPGTNTDPLDEILDFVENYGVSASMEHFDKTQSRAKAKQAIQDYINSRVDELEDRLLDKAIILDNEETAVRWDDIVTELNQLKEKGASLTESTE